MSRAKRSIYNFLSVFGLSAVQMIVGLISTRLLVAWLGEERLGSFRAVTDSGGYLSLLDIGMGGALVSIVARAVNRRDPAELAEAMASGFHGYRVIALLNLVGGAVLVWLMPLLIHVNPELTSDLRTATALIAAGGLLVPLAPLRQLWEAEQRGYRVTLILLLQSLVITGASLLLAWIGWGIAGQALALLLGFTVYSAALSIQTLYRHRDLVRWFVSKPSRAAKAQLWALNWPMLVLNVSGRLSLLTDNIVIAYFIGAKAVVPFFLAQRLPQIAVSQLQSVGNATWPGMLHLLETEGQEVFNDRIRELTQLIVVLGVSAMGPIVVYNAAFVELWMPHQSLYAGDTLTVLAAVNGILLALFSFWGWLFTGTGRIRALVPLSGATVIVNFAMSMGLTVWLRSVHPEWSLIGPVLGTTVAFVTCECWSYPILLRRTFHVPLSSLLTAVAKPLVVTLPLTTVIFIAARTYPPRHWVLLMIEMAGAGSGHLLLAWGLVLSAEQRKIWTERVVRGVPFSAADHGPPLLPLRPWP